MSGSGKAPSAPSAPAKPEQPTEIQTLAALVIGLFTAGFGHDLEAAEDYFEAAGLVRDGQSTDSRRLLVLSHELQAQGMLPASLKLVELRDEGAYDE